VATEWQRSSVSGVVVALSNCVVTRNPSLRRGADLGRHPQTLLAFCESAYEAGARLAGWDTIAFTSSACPSPDDLQDLQATAAGQFGRAVAS
jgi:hypothetical protein